jgi:putative integral membrane protein (TIGR02587 family)
VSDEAGPWATEATDLVRGLSGGLLFGIPLLFTMEMWWIGSTTAEGPMLAALGLTFCVVLLLNRTSGFRSTKDIRWGDAAADAVEALALALVSVLVLLVVLQQIDFDTPLREVLGIITYESMPFGIGIALAHHYLHRNRSEDDEGSEGEFRRRPGSTEERGSMSATVADLGATVIGSVFVAFNIAPTDEVPMLAAAMGPPALIAVVLLSLAVTFAVVFVAGFSNQEQRHQQKGLFQRPVTETAAAYLVSLVSAAAMLWFFQRLGPGIPPAVSLSYVLILGLPASVGGAAGRLAV